MSAFIILTIGPVQGYISQARRTQDLWQGSRILSYLASQGVHYAMDKDQTKGLAEIIYPAIKDGQTDNIPNRMVVKWNGDEVGARDCAAKMEKAIRDAWHEVSQNTLTYFNGAKEDQVRKIWERQEEKWLECYWVVVAEKAEKSYSWNLQQANAAIGARKLLRNFPQISEEGRKCSITGEHEALHLTGDYAEFWQARKADENNLALLGSHERLSAISTIKRFAHEEVECNGDDGKKTWCPINKDLEIKKRFPSTSSIAAAPFKYDVLKALLDKDREDTADLQAALQAFIAALLNCYQEPGTIPVKSSRDPAFNLFFRKHGNFNPEEFKCIEAIEGLSFDTGRVRDAPELWVTQVMCIDGDYLFEDTLITKTIAEYLPAITANKDDLPKYEKQRERVLKPKIAVAQEALRALIKAASALGIPKPEPYLVILSMDGDHMGRTLGELKNEDQHRKFSKTVADFARSDVKTIVETNHLGRVVYAGGDDVLALLPVRDALQVADELRVAFAAKITGANISNCNDQSITVHASTGLAYVHHTHNLQDAGRAAGDAQKHVAKDHYDRNAIAVEFLRRSGEPRTMGHKWQATDQTLVEHLSVLIDAFKNGLSRNLPSDIAEISYSMASPDVPHDASTAELKRVIKRRLSEKTGDKSKVADTLVVHVLALVTIPNKESNKEPKQDWANAQHWLELARFIAQKEG